MYKVSIKHLLSSSISGNRVLNRHIACFLKLKSLYNGGSIHSIVSNKKNISSMLGISESKFRSHLSFFYKEGLCWNGDGGELRVISTDRLFKKYVDCERPIKRKFIIDNENISIKDIELYLVALASEECKTRQKFALEKKHIDRCMLHYGKIENEKTVKAIRRGIRKKLRNAISVSMSSRVTHKHSYIDKKEVNMAVTSSRKSIAKILGLSSTSSGSNLVRKMVLSGIVSDSKNFVKVACNVTKATFYKMDLPGSYLFYKGNVLKRYPNTVLLNKYQ